jgi:two-component system, cell cycle sensor histidine kinase and response regulator CckA
LVRRVVDASEPILFSDFASDRSIDRASLAHQCGLEDAIGIPIGDGKGIVGVLIFFADTIAQPDDDLVRCFKTIGEQLASFARQEKVAAALRTAEEKALQLQKLETVGTLVGGFAHDFNNLMTVILGYGDLLLDEGVDKELSHEAVHEIFDAAKQASTLTRRLLTISRKDAAEPAAIDLNSVIERMEPIIRRVAGKGIESEFCLGSGLGETTALPGQMEQLIMNLVMNARDAMSGQGQLTICTREITVDNIQHGARPQLNPGRYISLIVRDTGCGMDEVLKNRIFEPFFTTKTAAKGTGIGLSTVRDTVNRCQGQIVVESEPGRGTTFELLFPRSVKGLECWVVTSAPHLLANGTETVVLVDDEPAVRRLMGRVLRTRGYTVIECERAEAVRTTKRHSGAIDLLVIDVGAADASSVETSKRLLIDRPDVRVLFLGTLGDVPDGWHVLQKPFTTHELAVAVRESLAAKVDARRPVASNSLVAPIALFPG